MSQDETVLPAAVPAAETLGEAAGLEPAVAAPVVKAAPRAMTSSSRRDGDQATGVGRRKTAVSRVVIKPGTGKWSINGKEPKDYFKRMKLIDEIHQPYGVTGSQNRFDTSATVKGSSLASQAGAVRLAIARALAAWQQDFRPALSTGHLLTRDPRMVERKKYGIRGARRRPQWTKR